LNKKLNSQRMFRVKLIVAHPYKMNLQGSVCLHKKIVLKIFGVLSRLYQERG